MKRILFLIALVMGFVSADAQNWQKVAGYWEYKFLRIDGTLGTFTPPRDTLAAAASGSIAVKGDNLYVKKANGTWAGIAALAQLGLQQITDNGNKTTDTVIVNGVRTPVILPDTADKSDYTFIVLPDMQGMTYQHPEQIRSITQWIRDNTTTENIKAVLTLGDITELATDTEFMRADTLFKVVDSLGLPYLPIVGNHDYNGGGIFGPSYRANVSQWNAWFGVSRYAGRPWYGNAFHGNTANHYIKFNVDAKKYLVIGLEFMPTDSAMTWAQSVIDSNLDRHTIITTHGYITAYGERSTDTSAYAQSWVYNLSADNNGVEMWEKFIRKNKTIDFVFGGHFIYNGGGIPVGNFARISEAGNHGNAIHQIMCDYQAMGKSGGDVNNGQGFFLKVRFSPRTGMAHLSMYSPYLNTFDPALDSFYVDYPVTKVDGSLSIENGLYGRGEARFDSSVYLQKLARGRVLITKENGQISAIPDQAANTFYAGPSSGGAANPTFRAISASDLPSGSNNYIKNQNLGFTPQIADFNINGTGAMGYSTSPTPSGKILDINGTIGVTQGLNYPTYGFVGGAGSSINLVHGNGSYGLSITRAGSNQNGANLALFRTWGSTADVKTAVPPGNMVGRISFQHIASDNNGLTIGSSIIGYAATSVLPGVSQGWFAFTTTGDDGGQSYLRTVISSHNNVSFMDTHGFVDGATGETDHSKLRLEQVVTGALDYSILNMTPTWNTTGSPTAIKMNITNTASGDTAKIIDLGVNGLSKFKINKAGVLTMGAYGADTVTGTPVSTLGVTSVGKVINVPQKLRYALTSTVTVSASDTITSVVGSGSGVGTLIVPANTLVPGKSYRVTLRGKVSTDASNPANFTYKIFLGSTELLSSGGAGIGSGRTDINYEVKAEITCRSIGAFGTIVSQGMFFKDDGPGAKAMTPTASFLDTTISNAFNLTVKMSDGSAGNNWYAYILIFEEI